MAYFTRSKQKPNVVQHVLNHFHVRQQARIVQRAQNLALFAGRHGSQPMLFTSHRIIPPPHRTLPSRFFFLACLVYDGTPDSFACAPPLCDFCLYWPSRSALGSKEPTPYFGVLYYKKYTRLKSCFRGRKRPSFPRASLSRRASGNRHAVSCGPFLVIRPFSLLPRAWCVLNVETSPLLSIRAPERPWPDVIDGPRCQGIFWKITLLGAAPQHVYCLDHGRILQNDTLNLAGLLIRPAPVQSRDCSVLSRGSLPGAENLWKKCTVLPSRTA